MKKKFVFIIMLLAATAARAFDFSAVTSSGHQVYYSIFEGTTDIVAVNPGWGDSDAPAGLLVLDATVVHDGTTYHLTAIDANAFQSCYDLTGVVIPEGVTFIGRMAFAFCSALDSVVLPSTLEQIGTMAFTSTAFLDNPANMTPEGMLISGTYLIATRSNVEDSLVVPEGITGLGNMSLYHCRLLNKVVLPSTLRFIGGLAFQDCLALDTVELHTTVPPTLGYDAFLNAGACIMAVPCSTAATYQAVEEWQGMTFVERCPDTTPDPPDPPDPPEAIDLANGEATILVTAMEGGIAISLNGIECCTVSDMTGRTVATTHRNKSFIPLPAPGVYIVSAPGIKALKVVYFK